MQCANDEAEWGPSRLSGGFLAIFWRIALFCVMEDLMSHIFGIPINQTLWMLLVASLVIVPSLAALHLLGTTDRKPGKKPAMKKRSR